MGTNRYTSLTPSKFNPLSLQEQMMIPLAKQSKHDQALKNISEQGLVDVNNLQKDNEYISNSINDFKSKLTGVEDSLMQSGISSDVTKRLINLKRQREYNLSKQGDWGKATNAYDAYKANEKALNSNSNLTQEQKQLGLAYAYNQYTGVKNDGAFSPYLGANKVDLTKRALDLGSKMKPQTYEDAALQAGWKVEILDGRKVYRKNGQTVTELPANEIARIIGATLASDSKTMSYLNDLKTIKPGFNPATEVTNAAAQAALILKQHKIKTTDDIKFIPKGNENVSGVNGDMNLISNPAKAIVTDKYIPRTSMMDMVFGNDPTYLQNYSEARQKLEKTINDYNKGTVSEDDLITARRNLYNLEETKNIVDSAMENRKVFNKSDLKEIARNMTVISNVGAKDIKPFTDEELLQGIAEGSFSSYDDRYFLDFDRKDGRIGLYDKKLKRTGIIKITKSLRNKIENYNKDLEQKLKNSAIIPYRSLVISNNTPKALATQKNLNNVIGNSIFNGQNISDIKMSDDTKNVITNFKNYGDSSKVKFSGFVTSEGSGEVFASVKIPYYDEDSEKYIDRNINYPLGFDKNTGKLSGLTTHLFKTLRSEGDKNSINAINKLERIIRTRNLLPDNNGGKVDYTSLYTNNYKQTVSLLNNNNGTNLFDSGLPITNDLYNSKGIQIITNANITTNKKTSIKDNMTTTYINNIKQPRGYSSLMYKNKDGKDSYMTIQDYRDILKYNFPNLSDEKIDSTIKASMSDRPGNHIYVKKGIANNPDTWSTQPFIVKGYENLIQFR